MLIVIYRVRLRRGKSDVPLLTTMSTTNAFPSASFWTNGAALFPFPLRSPLPHWRPVSCTLTLLSLHKGNKAKMFFGLFVVKTAYLQYETHVFSCRCQGRRRRIDNKLSLKWFSILTTRQNVKENINERAAFWRYQAQFKTQPAHVFTFVVWILPKKLLTYGT